MVELQIMNKPKEIPFLYSVGYIAAVCRVPVIQLQELAEAEGITASIVINNIQHFDHAAYRRLLEVTR